MRSYFAFLIVPFSTILFFFLIIFTYSKFLGPIPFSLINSQAEVFTVNGEGKVSVKPDTATLVVGVTATGQTAKEAQEKMNENINKVSEGIKNLGIKNEDIKTENFNVYPNYDNIRPLPAVEPATSEDKPIDNRITGYTAQTNLRIKAKDEDLANKVLDLAVQNGANQIGGVTFEVGDREKYESEARSKAVEDAKKKAQEAAKSAGFKLGKIIGYSESSAGGPILYDRASISAVAPEAKQTQLELGSSDVVINVTISYQIQ